MWIYVDNKSMFYDASLGQSFFGLGLLVEGLLHFVWALAKRCEVKGGSGCLGWFSCVLRCSDMFWWSSRSMFCFRNHLVIEKNWMLGEKTVALLDPTSGQHIIFHRTRFPWNKGISLPELPFGVRSCEVAIIWPATCTTTCIARLTKNAVQSLSMERPQ